MNPIQASHVDDQPAIDLGLPVRRVPLTARHDLDLPSAAEADHLLNVARRPGQEHRDWRVVDDLAYVVGEWRKGRWIGAQLAVQVWDSIEGRRPRLADP